MARALRPPRWDKTYKNKAEQQCAEELRSLGWQVTKRGWPDFFCIKDGEIACVEVKPRPTCRMTTTQTLIMDKLKSHGIPCYLWMPSDKLKLDK